MLRYTRFGLSKLLGRASPAFKDVLTGAKEVRFAFPRWPQKAFSVRFLAGGDESTPASYGPVAGNLVDLQTLDGHGDVVFGNVDGGGIDVAVKDVVRPAEMYWGRSVMSW